MTCHSQIWTNASCWSRCGESLADNKPIQWTRVAKLPDYVFFRHDIHIAKGVGCESCHGRIDQMALTFRPRPSRWSSASTAIAIPRRICGRRITSPTWPGSRLPMREAKGEAIAAHEGIRIGELTHCYVCHR